MTTPAPTFNPSLSVASDKAGRTVIRCADCGKDKPHAGLGLCRACYQRAWKAGALPAKVRREGERRDCQCKKAQHQHGTRLAYVVDRCRCRACLAAITPAVEAAFAAAGVRLPLLPEQEVEPGAEQLDLLGEAS